jgi:hypothetical protein
MRVEVKSSWALNPMINDQDMRQGGSLSEATVILLAREKVPQLSTLALHLGKNKI